VLGNKASIKNGAKSVIGIEDREKSVDLANKNMDFYKISKEKYQFVVGDVTDGMIKFPPKKFDTFLFWNIISSCRSLAFFIKYKKN